MKNSDEAKRGRAGESSGGGVQGIVLGRMPTALQDELPTVDSVLGRADLGRWLCAHRRARGDSLYVVAERLGYSNINFLSNVERGRQTLPLARVPDYAMAYGFEDLHVFGMVVLLTTHPDVWHSLKRVFYAGADEEMLGKKEKFIRERFVRDLKEDVERAEQVSPGRSRKKT